MHSITAPSAPLRQNCGEDTQPNQGTEAFSAGGSRKSGETHSAQGNAVCHVQTQRLRWTAIVVHGEVHQG